MDREIDTDPDNMKKAKMPEKGRLSPLQKKAESDYNLNRQLGINMRYYRRVKGIEKTGKAFTQMDIAYKANLTPYIISNIESKPYYQARACTIKDIADALEIDICELICSLH